MAVTEALDPVGIASSLVDMSESQLHQTLGTASTSTVQETSSATSLPIQIPSRTSTTTVERAQVVPTGQTLPVQFATLMAPPAKPSPLTARNVSAITSKSEGLTSQVCSYTETCCDACSDCDDACSACSDDCTSECDILSECDDPLCEESSTACYEPCCPSNPTREATQAACPQFDYDPFVGGDSFSDAEMRDFNEQYESYMIGIDSTSHQQEFSQSDLENAFPNDTIADQAVLLGGHVIHNLPKRTNATCSTSMETYHDTTWESEPAAQAFSFANASFDHRQPRVSGEETPDTEVLELSSQASHPYQAYNMHSQGQGHMLDSQPVHFDPTSFPGYQSSDLAQQVARSANILANHLSIVEWPSNDQYYATPAPAQSQVPLPMYSEQLIHHHQAAMSNSSSTAPTTATHSPRPFQESLRQPSKHTYTNTSTTYHSAADPSHQLHHHHHHHTSHNIFYCHFGCGYSAKSQAEVASHENARHTGLKPYKCSVCDKCFADSSGRSKHMRTHERRKALQCPYCVERASANTTSSSTTATNSALAGYTRADQVKRHCRVTVANGGKGKLRCACPAVLEMVRTGKLLLDDGRLDVCRNCVHMPLCYERRMRAARDRGRT